MDDKCTWKSDEVDFRLAKMLIATLLSDGLINEDEAAQAVENALSEAQPLIGMLEADLQ